MAAIHFRRRFFLLTLYAVLPCGMFVVLLLGWLVSTEKATTVLQSADSPDGRYRAEVVRQDPGVSSSYKYMVRVMPAGLSAFERSLDALPISAVYIALSLQRDPDKLKVSWSGRQTVTIHCDRCEGATSGKERWRDVSLKYELR